MDVFGGVCTRAGIDQVKKRKSFELVYTLMIARVHDARKFSKLVFELVFVGFATFQEPPDLLISS